MSDGKITIGLIKLIFEINIKITSYPFIHHKYCTQNQDIKIIKLK